MLLYPFRGLDKLKQTAFTSKRFRLHIHESLKMSLNGAVLRLKLWIFLSLFCPSKWATHVHASAQRIEMTYREASKGFIANILLPFCKMLKIYTYWLNKNIVCPWLPQNLENLEKCQFCENVSDSQEESEKCWKKNYVIENSRNYFWSNLDSKHPCIKIG